MTAVPDPARRLTPVVRLAPAKLNLTLAVLGIRPDGYHDLHSVMVPLDLADRLSVSILPPGGTDSLHVDGFDPGPVADNLVLRAFAAARRHARPEWGRAEPPPALAARLEKRIPVAAGWPAARPTPPPPWTPPWRPGASSWIPRPATGSRRSWARTSRSSWPAAPPWSRVAGSG